jgi:hypothetical protein
MWEVSVPMIKDYPVYNFKADFRVRKEFLTHVPIRRARLRR